VSSLGKGQGINVEQFNITVGLGWKSNPENGYAYDLDASAFMLGKNDKTPEDSFLVYYNNLQSKDCCVKLSNDNTRGTRGDNDCETISVDLGRVDIRIEQILFTVTIHEADLRKHNFGMVHDSYIHIYDSYTGKELARYDLEEDFSVETAVEFARLCRTEDGWTFQALGNGYKGGLKFFVDKYVYNWLAIDRIEGAHKTAFIENYKNI